MSNSARRPVLVTGSHRSGSTWIGRLLAAADELHYVQEPFNIVAHQRWMHPRPEHQFLHVTDANEASWLAPVQQVVDLNYPLGAHLARRPGLKMSRRASRVALDARRARRSGAAAMIKDPIAVFSTPWIARRFDAVPVVMVRDAVPFVGSLLDRGWSFDFSHWTAQPTLMAELDPWTDEIERMATQPGELIDQAILMWNAIYGFVAGLPAALEPLGIQAHIEAYETIASNPLVEVEHLYGRLGLEFGIEQRRVAIELSTGRSQADDGTGVSAIDVQRDSSAALKTWRDRLDQDQIEHITTATAEVAGCVAQVVRRTG